MDGSSALNTVNEILDLVECDQTDKNGNCCLAPKVEFDNARNKSEPEGNYSLTVHFFNCCSSKRTTFNMVKYLPTPFNIFLNCSIESKSNNRKTL